MLQTGIEKESLFGGTKICEVQSFGGMTVKLPSKWTRMLLCVVKIGVISLKEMEMTAREISPVNQWSPWFQRGVAPSVTHDKHSSGIVIMYLRFP